jgi:large subunit ribosomal protein L32
MAVPKKRTSKSKKNSRLANWSNKATVQAQKALSLAKSVLSGESTSFIYTSTSEDNKSDS